MLNGCACHAVSQNTYKAVSSEMHDDEHCAMCVCVRVEATLSFFAVVGFSAQITCSGDSWEEVIGPALKVQDT